MIYSFIYKIIIVNSVIYSLVDHTRVILRETDPNVPGSDYINANIITVSVKLILPFYINILKILNVIHCNCNCNCIIVIVMPHTL